MKLGWQPRKWLEKKARAGFRGYPVATVAYYGPDDRRATKMVVGVISGPDREPADLRRWFCEDGDVRKSEPITAEAVAFIRSHHVHSVSMVSGIIGCPHEEGVDYPEGGECPACPFWAGRDRWAALGSNRSGA